MNPPEPCPHYCDNQGLCHSCGVLLDEHLWNEYIGLSDNGAGLVFTLKQGSEFRTFRIDAVNSFRHVLTYSYRVTDPELAEAIGEWDSGRSISTCNRLTELLQEFRP